MTAKRINESGTLHATKGSGGVYPVRIITEGKGSSGVYSRELLEQYKDAFVGVPMFNNHPKNPDKPWERGVEQIVGRLGHVVEARDEDGVLGLYSEAHISGKWQEFVEEYGDLIGLSVYIEGEGRDEDGEWVVESFNGADPYRSVDLVVAAGRGGRFERAMESMRAIEASQSGEDGTGTPAADGNEGRQKMDELKALLEALAKSVDEKFTALEAKVDSIKTLSESVAEGRQVLNDAGEVVAEFILAISEAEVDLPKESLPRILESVKGGKSPKDAIEGEAKYVKSIAEAVSTNDGAGFGRVVEGAPSGGKLHEILGVSK